jgi:uncharacterized membrane protein YgcG
VQDAIQGICDVGFAHAAKLEICSPSLGTIGVLIDRLAADIGSAEVAIKVARAIVTLC